MYAFFGNHLYLECLPKINSSTFSEQIHTCFLPIPAKSSAGCRAKKFRNPVPCAGFIFLPGEGEGGLNGRARPYLVTVLHSDSRVKLITQRRASASIGGVLFARSGTGDSERAAARGKSQKKPAEQ